jgi:hypothetical protein
MIKSNMVFDMHFIFESKFMLKKNHYQFEREKQQYELQMIILILFYIFADF